MREVIVRAERDKTNYCIFGRILGRLVRKYLYNSKKSSTFALAFEMKRFWYILLILVSIGVQWFEPMNKPTVQPVQTSGCAVQQTDHHTLVGIQGEPLTLANNGSNITTSVPTHFSANTQRTPFGKNRTRTAFLRKMIHHYQPVFIVFRGQERLETSPFCSSAGNTYYVYFLRRILC